ncbi:MAG: sulfite exporter TauE/SafE family protein [Fimbriimonadaceae bacterium]|nr:sulfite exporter TauE/SafE family protein [Fimbriimonadaceae bacterium]QYK56334.1 MAG: sulfite exporter TauE/SafE family protein [Fimbriimonadaceae bacterium]
MPALESPLGLALLFLAGLAASAVNAIAGGGSLVSFPTLVGLGMPALPANATNSVALWPGSLSGALGYANRFAETKRYLWLLLPPTVLGSAVGAWLLVTTSARSFQVLVPFLILIATLLLAFQPAIRRWAVERTEGRHPSSMGLLGGLLQFAVSLYGGYFGAGMGIMMLAVIGLLADHDVHGMNALKNWLSVVINIAASTLFIVRGLVSWGPCLAVMAGSVLGGFFSARLSQRVPSETLRRLIVVYGVGMTAWFFWKAFGPF